MNDRELLEMAAKAAGLEISNGAPFEGVKGDYLLLKKCDHLVEWNPLADDGDALRLVAQLKIGVWHSRWPNGKSYVASHKVWDAYDSMFYDDGVAHGDDPAAATRRAIVRAAAEIGRAMT